MKRILWEQDAQGSTAVRELTPGGYISPPAARLLITRLMHELTTVSANFADHGSVSFLRVISVSEFDKQGGHFYGLYTSGDESNATSAPNYSLRRVTWSTKFKSIESVLDGIKTKTLFFNSSQTATKWQNIVKSIDTERNNELTRFEQIEDPNGDSRADKNVNFFGVTSGIILQGEYRSKEVRNRYLEARIEQFSSMFAELESSADLFPDQDSFRVSYDFDRCSFLFN